MKSCDIAQMTGSPHGFGVHFSKAHFLTTRAPKRGEVRVLQGFLLYWAPEQLWNEACGLKNIFETLPLVISSDNNLEWRCFSESSTWPPLMRTIYLIGVIPPTESSLICTFGLVFDLAVFGPFQGIRKSKISKSLQNGGQSKKSLGTENKAFGTLRHNIKQYWPGPMRGHAWAQGQHCFGLFRPCRFGGHFRAKVWFILLQYVILLSGVVNSLFFTTSQSQPARFFPCQQPPPPGLQPPPPSAEDKVGPACHSRAGPWLLFFEDLKARFRTPIIFCRNSLNFRESSRFFSGKHEQIELMNPESIQK